MLEAYIDEFVDYMKAVKNVSDYNEANLSNKGYTIHKLRHTYVSLLIQNCTDLISIQQLLGHIDLNSTKIYTHTDMTHF